MSFKNLLFAVAAFAATPAFAATYYVTPEGAGTKDGSTWENAFDTEGFRVQASKNSNGDIYYLGAGIYKPSETIVFQTATGAKVYGNETGERTIFSGDKNGNNNPESGDANRLIRFQANTVDGNKANAIVIKNIDFTCVFMNTNNASDNMGALMVDNSGDVSVENCNFYNNWSDGEQGGVAAHLYRSTVKFSNCEFRNNSANYRGGAVRLRSNAGTKGVTTFENCVFKNNTNYHQLGGAIIGQQTKAVNIINCIFANNKSAQSGTAIYINGKDNDYANQLTIINSTFAGNANSGTGNNGQICSTQTANIRLMNSIIVSNDDKTSDFYFSGNTASETFSFVSGGYNYTGTVLDDATPAVEELDTRADETVAKINWLATDTHGPECTYASVFGTNKINSDNVIEPVKYVAGANNAYLTAIGKEWNLPEETDLTKDINGDTRADGSMPGSASITEDQVSEDVNSAVIGILDNNAQTLQLYRTGNAVFTIDGSENGITVYSINGAKVMSTSENSVDLSSLTQGVYLLRTGNSTFKVVR